MPIFAIKKITVYINTKSKDETHWGDDEINILDMIDNSTILKPLCSEIKRNKILRTKSIYIIQHNLTQASNF